MWWRVGERAAIPCITPTVKHRWGSVMVSGGVCQLQSWEFASGEGQMNQTSYHSILQHHMIPSGMWLVAQGFVLMQDNDPKHTCKLCQRYIKSKKEQHVLQLMSWLAQSADLKPIELVWDELDWKIRAKQPTNVTHLWCFLQESWVELSSVYLQSLVERMLRICEEVIVAKGGHFDDSKVYEIFLFFWFNLYLMWLKKIRI